jgi:formylglycine-generating enzyme required for sulfatase activity
MVGRYWYRSVERLKDLERVDWLRTEVRAAFKAGLTVIPVLVDNAAMPQKAELPRGMKSLPDRQQAEIHNDQSFDDDVAKLVGQLRDVPLRDIQELLEPGTVRVNPVDGLAYVWIPGGSFDMGAVDGDEDAHEDEQPPEGMRRVQISRGFWLCRTEVTVDAYHRFAKSERRNPPDAWKGNPSWKRTDHPMVKVTWDDASAYCDWAGGRLPSEAEWEYAARGGVSGRRFPYDKKAPTSDEVNRHTVRGKKRYKFTSPVDWSRQNGFGLHDMAGNVWEWVADWYDPAEYRKRTTEASRTDPVGWGGPGGAAPPTGERVVRGGSWEDKLRELRVSNRRPLAPDIRNTAVGFRCVLDRLAG